jgi:hypothetical protein
MPNVISANRLADGIVVYAGRNGFWVERLNNANIFADKAEAEASLLLAQNDAKRNLVVDPCLVEVTEDASGLRAVTLRETIRAQGPTIDFLPPRRAFRATKQETKALLRIPRSEDPREHELMSATDSPDHIAR